MSEHIVARALRARSDALRKGACAEVGVDALLDLKVATQFELLADELASIGQQPVFAGDHKLADGRDHAHTARYDCFQGCPAYAEVLQNARERGYKISDGDNVPVSTYLDRPIVTNHTPYQVKTDPRRIHTQIEVTPAGGTITIGADRLRRAGDRIYEALTGADPSRMDAGTRLRYQQLAQIAIQEALGPDEGGMPQKSDWRR